MLTQTEVRLCVAVVWGSIVLGRARLSPPAKKGVPRGGDVVTGGVEGAGDCSGAGSIFAVVIGAGLVSRCAREAERARRRAEAMAAESAC